MHEVEWDFDTVGTRGFGEAAGGEAGAAVKALEFGAVVDEAQFHLAKAGRATMGFDGRHELRA